MDKVFFTFSCFSIIISHPVPQPQIVIRKSQSGMISAENNLTLNAEISFNNSAVVNVSILLTISWSRNDDIITSSDHITISNVSDSGSGYAASLTYLPITTCDSGLITANITASPSDDSMYIQSVTVTTTDTITVEGTNLIVSF